MRIWSLANQKGGVAKTTSTVALGALAASGGDRVLLVDLDPQSSLTSYFRQDPDSLELSSFTLFEERERLTTTGVARLIRATAYHHLDVLPGSSLLATLERQAIGPGGSGLILGQALALIRDRYDLVLVDTPPQLGVLMINALAACQFLVIPVQTEHLALKGLERMTRTLEMLGKSRQQPLDYVIVPVMYDRRTQASVGSLLTLRDEYGERVWPGRIPIDTRLRDASKAGVPPHLFDPEGRAVEAYASLLKWLQRHAQADGGWHE